MSGFIIHILFAYLLLLLTTGISHLLFRLFFVPFPYIYIALLFDVIILIVASIGVTSIIKLFKVKFKLSAPLFIIFAQLPVVIFSTLYFLSLTYNSFLFHALDNPIIDSELQYFLTLMLSISSTVILFFTIIVCIISHVRKKDKK